MTLPHAADPHLSQSEEWCTVTHDGRTERIGFHEYDRIFSIPGLYEHLFYERLACDSPRVVSELLGAALGAAKQTPQSLRGIDLGAGNGMVGEALRARGVASLVAVDIIPEAAAACRRDRPKVYQDYVVADVTQLTDTERERLVAHRPNLLTTVAALGFGDVPSRAFAEAWNLVTTDAWVAFNIKEGFLDPAVDESGFAKLVRRMIQSEIFLPQKQERYQHRLSVSGRPLHYIALVGKKTAQLPGAWLEDPSPA